MRSPLWLIMAFLLLAPLQKATAFKRRYLRLLNQTNAKIEGHVVDFTHNHGKDNRIWSRALCAKRDLYVYLPPCFDPKKRYPLVLWLHGFAQDEVSFLEYVVPGVDKAITSGKFPPVIFASPDGTFRGRACLTNAGSFYLNSKSGRYEDYLMQDVWSFLHKEFPIRPEPEAHALTGASMGGQAAYNKGIKYRHLVRNIVGIYPPLNTRWISCRGKYRDNFHPDNWGWRTNFSRHFEVVARFYCILTFRLGQIVRPLYGTGPDVWKKVALENPIEMVSHLHLKPGDLEMFVGYGGKDEFNIDAQIESFLHVLKMNHIPITVVYEPEGRHDAETARKFIPAAMQWMAVRLAPYSPGACPP